MIRKIKQLSKKLSYSWMQSSKNGISQNSLRVCSVYYQIFSALLYREAKALTNEGISVDIICYYTNRAGKDLRSYKGINIYPIQSRSSRETSNILYLLRLIQFFFKSFLFLSYSGIVGRYKVIHFTSPPDFLVFSAIIPKLFGAKIILDIHDIGPEFYMRRLGVGEDHPVVTIIKFMEKLATRFSDHVITVTDLWRNRLIARSTTPSKCTTLLNVPDDELFQNLSKNNCKISNNFNLYYHGSLEELFGVDTLIFAMPTIVEKIQNVKLHIYGGGRLLDDCKELVKKFGINESVCFHNSVPFDELPRILAQADIGIVPTKGSVFSGEILAMKSLEYISLGIPIVISKTKGHSYYYDSSMVKFFEPGDKDDLAKAVIDLYTNEAERKMLRTQSRSFIEKFGWQNTKKTYTQIVQNLSC